MLTRMGKAPLIAACFLTAPAMSMPYAYHALAGPVDAARRACRSDDDCALIAIGCVLPCVGEGTEDPARPGSARSGCWRRLACVRRNREPQRRNQPRLVVAENQFAAVQLRHGVHEA